jgi:hypothetical protein
MNEFQIPPERDLPRGQLERRSRHLVQELTRSRRRRRLMLSLVPAVVILLVGATGFSAYVLQKDEPTHFESIGCYDRADLDANVAIISADGRGAIAQCRELWAQGALGEGAPARLAACVLNTGPIGVFPSTDARACERLGLANLSVEGLTESRRFVRMRSALYAELGTPPSGSSRGSSKCVGERRATAIVRRVLGAHGYSDWKVATTGNSFSSERPCAQVAFDGEAKTALLIASERNQP